MVSVLVTGGAGFIGSHVVDLLVEQGYDIAVIDDLSHGFRQYVNPRASFHKVDICERKALDDVFKKEKPDYVIHQAAHIDVRKSLLDPGRDAQINIVGSVNLLECCQRHNIKKFVFASTGGAIYGEPKNLPAKEATPEMPMSPYGVSKLAFEKYLNMYNRLYGLDYVSLRYANVYGPRQDPLGEAGVIAIFTRQLLEGGKPQINGDGKQTRDFVYVGDVAKANLKALKNKTEHKIFNIGTGAQTSVNEIYSILSKKTGSETKANHVNEIQGEVRNISLDYALARKELGWKPQTKLESGLEQTMKWFQGKNTPK